VLTATLAELLRTPHKEYPHFAAGLMFMHHLRAEEATAHLDQRAAALDQIITKFEVVLADLLRRGVSRLALIEVEHKIAMLDAERTWVRKLAREIEEGKLEWKVGIGSGHEALRRIHGQHAH
jgi:hypothetical protein